MLRRFDEEGEALNLSIEDKYFLKFPLTNHKTLKHVAVKFYVLINTDFYGPCWMDENSSFWNIIQQAFSCKNFKGIIFYDQPSIVYLIHLCKQYRHNPRQPHEQAKQTRLVYAYILHFVQPQLYFELS